MSTERVKQARYPQPAGFAWDRSNGLGVVRRPREPVSASERRASSLKGYRPVLHDAGFGGDLTAGRLGYSGRSPCALPGAFCRPERAGSVLREPGAGCLSGVFDLTDSRWACAIAPGPAIHQRPPPQPRGLTPRSIGSLPSAGPYAHPRRPPHPQGACTSSPHQSGGVSSFTDPRQLRDSPDLAARRTSSSPTDSSIRATSSFSSAR